MKTSGLQCHDMGVGYSLQAYIFKDLRNEDISFQKSFTQYHLDRW